LPEQPECGIFVFHFYSSVCSAGLVWSYSNDPTERSTDLLLEVCLKGSGCRKRVLGFNATLSATMKAAADTLVKEVYTNFPGTQYFCKSKVSYIAEANAVDGFFFCKDYVDYAAACDAHNQASCNNTWTIEIHKTFQNSLGYLRCRAYSAIERCTNCSDAYKRWLCATTWRKHIIPGTARTEEGKVRDQPPSPSQ
jgi:hypothetical protein